MHRDLVRCSYEKNFRALCAIGSPEWREHTHTQKLSFIDIDYERKKKYVCMKTSIYMRFQVLLKLCVFFLAKSVILAYYILINKTILN